MAPFINGTKSGGRRTIYYIFIILYAFNFWNFGVSSFNIEWHYPIIIKNSGALSPNYFGASVTFLKSDHDAAWVIIGAPKANSTYPTHNGIREPGVIWQCSVGKRTESCRPLVMDETGNSQDGKVFEKKDDGFLGGPGTVALDEKNFIACASQWHKRDYGGKSLLALRHGTCYKRPKSDLFKEELPPLPSDFKLNPLEDLQERKKPWTQGQAGFAVHLPKTGNEIIMSAPGTEAWRGSLIQYLSRDGGKTFGDSFVSEPLKNGLSIGAYNYFGYSITSGYIFEIGATESSYSRNSAGGKADMQNALIQYVAGAPRGGNLAGKVIILRFPEKSDDSLKILQEIVGEQIGSYFGASVLAIDVNGDNFDDLLVGAPRQSRDLNTQIRSKDGQPFSRFTRGSALPVENFENFGGYGDEGVVFVYLSNGVTLTKQDRVLNGENRPWSHFGTAMTALGDMNKDGYQDFAISAPYQDGVGVVYIYHGSRDATLKRQQIIRAKEVDVGLRGFGISLGGNEDIDNNGFNDIVIGSFNSSQTVILRSQPIITVQGSISSELQKLPLDTLVFEVESCVTYSGKYVSPNVQLGVRFWSDNSFRPQRVHIKPVAGSGPFSNFREYNVSVSAGGEVCTKFSAKVIHPLELSGAPITFEQEIFIPGNTKWKKVMPMMMDIHPRGALSVTGEPFTSFCKTCPVINTEKPRRFKLQLPLAVRCGDDDICISDLHLAVTFPNITGIGYLIGSTSSITMDIKLTNKNETAIAPVVTVSWSRLKLKRAPSDCTVLSEDASLVIYKCNFGKLLEQDQMHQAFLEFDTSSLVVQETMLNDLIFGVNVSTASQMVRPESETIRLPLYASADLYVSGSRYLEVFNMKTLLPYIAFKHTFDIGMEGPSSVTNVRAVFQLPVNLTTNTKSIVNVRAVKVNNAEMICQPTKGQFSKSDSALDSPMLSSDDSDDPDFQVGGIGGFLPVEKDVSRESNSTLTEKRKLLIHCDSPFVACMEVTCKIALYKPDELTSISFIMDIEADTIRSLLKTHKVSSIQVESRGTLLLPESIKNIQPKSNKPDIAVSLTLIDLETAKPVSKWIYTLAVVIGLIILACVVICLYACGCFKKKDSKGENDQEVAPEEEMVPLQHNEDHTDLPKEETAYAGSNIPNSHTMETTDSSDGKADRRTSTGELLSPGTADTDMTEPPEFIPNNPAMPVENGRVNPDED